MRASTEGTKLCKDCTHYRPLVAGWWIFKIKGPSHLAQCAAFPNRVTGEAKGFCDIERTFTGPCGPEGKLWQQMVDYRGLRGIQRGH